MLTTQLGSELMLAREDSRRIRILCATRYQRWAYDFYPQQPDLALEAEIAAAVLGGAVVPFPGSAYADILCKLIGWRNVRSLQGLARRFGWKYIQKVKNAIRLRRFR